MRLHTQLEVNVLREVFAEMPCGYAVLKDGESLPQVGGRDIDILVVDLLKCEEHVAGILRDFNCVYRLVQTPNMTRFIVSISADLPLEIDLFTSVGKKWVTLIDAEGLPGRVYSNTEGVICMKRRYSESLTLVKDFLTYGELRDKNRDNGILNRVSIEDMIWLDHVVRVKPIYMLAITGETVRFAKIRLIRFHNLLNFHKIFAYVDRYFRTRWLR